MGGIALPPQRPCAQMCVCVCVCVHRYRDFEVRCPNKTCACAVVAKLNRSYLDVMPHPYSLDLRWRIIWSFICHRQSFADIASLFGVCERTVRRYVSLFQRTGDVKACQRRHGPLPLLGEFEQIDLYWKILAYTSVKFKRRSCKCLVSMCAYLPFVER